MNPLYHKNIISIKSISAPGIRIVLLACLILTFGCKKEDTSPPSVAVSTPMDGAGLQACDEVRIEGRASDNRGLGQVAATLVEPVTGQILGSKVVGVKGLEADFAFSFKLGDRYTEDGEYQLRVTASDAAGNTASDFVLLDISELPRKLLKTTWTGVSSNGIAQLYVLDTFNTVSLDQSIGQDLAAVVMDNRSQALLVAEAMTGRFDARSPEDFSLIFRTDLPVGSQQEIITDVAAAQNRYYLSTAVPPYVRVFDRSGLQISAWDQVLHPGYRILADADRVWLSVEGFGGVPLKVDVYGRNSQSLQAANPLGWRVTALGLAGDLLIAGGNDGGQGRVYLLDAVNLLTQESNDLTSEFLALAGAEDNWFVLLASGIWRLDVQSGNLQGPIVNGTFTSVAYERSTGNVFAGKENLVEVYSPTGTPIQSYPGNFNTVRWINFHYNK